MQVGEVFSARCRVWAGPPVFYWMTEEVQGKGHLVTLADQEATAEVKDVLDTHIVQGESQRILPACPAASSREAHVADRNMLVSMQRVTASDFHK